MIKYSQIFLISISISKGRQKMNSLFLTRKFKNFIEDNNFMGIQYFQDGVYVFIYNLHFSNICIERKAFQERVALALCIRQASLV